MSHHKSQRSANLVLGPASPELWLEALALQFQTCPPDERAARIDTALQLIKNGEFPSQGILIAHRGGLVEGVVLCMPAAGECGLVWPPQTRCEKEHEALDDSLLQAALRWLRSRGARLGQAILSPSELDAAPALLRNGFSRVTDLAYLRHPLTSLSPPARRLQLITLEECPSGLFAETLLSTYEGSLDCPEVNGRRSVEAILAGHRAQGAYDPRRW